MHTETMQVKYSICSGSMLIVEDQLDLVCYCMELDPKYVDVIIKRWEEQSVMLAN